MSRALGLDCLYMAVISRVDGGRMNRSSMIIVVALKCHLLPVTVFVDLPLSNGPTMS